MSNNYVKIFGNTKKAYEELVKDVDKSISELVDEGLQANLAWLNFLQLKNIGAAKIKYLSSQIGKKPTEEIILEVESIVSSIVELVAPEVIFAYKNLDKDIQKYSEYKLSDEEILSLEKLWMSEGSGIRINLSSPQFSHDYKDWKNLDRTKEGLDNLLRKYSRQNSINSGLILRPVGSKL